MKTTQSAVGQPGDKVRVPSREGDKEGVVQAVLGEFPYITDYTVQFKNGTKRDFPVSEVILLPKEPVIPAPASADEAYEALYRPVR